MYATLIIKFVSVWATLIRNSIISVG